LNYLTAAFSAAHWLGVAAYTGSFVFLILVFQKTYRRYRSYKYIDNFRAEAIALYWKILHIAFLVIIISGAALAGLGGKSVLKGLYGLIFSTKLALWLAQIYLSQDLLKPFTPEVTAESDSSEKTANEAKRSSAVLVLLLLIAVCGFVLKYV
jgi:hypothetical protein